MAAGNLVSAPGMQYTLVSADTVVANEDHKVLLVGSPLSAAATTAGYADGAVIRNYTGVESTDFNARSQLAGIIREFKLANSATVFGDDHVTKFDVLVVYSDATGTAFDWTCTFLGPATAAGVIKVYAGRDDKYAEYAVDDTETATAIAAGIEALWSASATFNLPYLAVDDGVGKMTFTSIAEGEDMRTGFKVDISGAPGITFGVVPVMGNAGLKNPDPTGIFDAVQNDRYGTVVWPWYEADGSAAVDDLEFVGDFLDARFNVNGRAMDGVAIVSHLGSLADHVFKGVALNSKSVVSFAMQETLLNGDGEACTPFQIPWEMSARFAGIRARRLTNGHIISDLVIASAALDQRGGAGIATLPYHNTPIDSALAADGLGWTPSEAATLETNGFSYYGQNHRGNATILAPVVTQYKTNAVGNPDPTWKYLNYIDTGSQAREYMINNLLSRYAQSRLTEGVIVRDREQENEASINAYLEQLFGDLADRAYTLCPKGEVALNFFKENKTVSLDFETGDVDVFMKIPIVTQLRNMFIVAQVSFTIQSV